jgi:hypothetical protein
VSGPFTDFRDEVIQRAVLNIAAAAMIQVFKADPRCVAQRVQFGRLARLLPLDQTEALTDYLAGVFVAPRPHQCINDALVMRGQGDVVLNRVKREPAT